MNEVRINERAWIEPIVERVVGQVLDSHAVQLRTEIVRRVVEEIAAAGLDANPSNAASGQAASAQSSPAQSGPGSSPGVDPAALTRAVSEIQAGNSQREILRALLDISSRYASRVALFVVKGAHATGWQARGFADNEMIKDFALDEATPAVVCAIRDRVLTTAALDDMDRRFLHQAGTPASGEVQILPLILKDKVAALLYADSGAVTGLLDISSLELLVLSTSAWLEVNSLRKQAQKEPFATQPENGVGADAALRTAPAAAPPPPAFNDPFAAHSPSFSSAPASPQASSAEATPDQVSPAEPPVQAMAAAASASDSALPGVQSMPGVGEGTATEPAAEVAAAAAITDARASTPSTAWGLMAEVKSSSAGAAVAASTSSLETPPLPDPLPVAPASFSHNEAETVSETSSASSAPSLSPLSSLSHEDQEVHRKAQRFARLLVDEIKLYNQAKVTEGRNHRDLYDRLKEVIDKSRVTYQKRYGTTVAVSGNYFEHEIIRSLAEDNISIMGANYRH